MIVGGVLTVVLFSQVFTPRGVKLSPGEVNPFQKHRTRRLDLDPQTGERLTNARSPADSELLTFRRGETLVASVSSPANDNWVVKWAAAACALALVGLPALAHAQEVNQGTIQQTICVPGWSAAYRRAHPPRLAHIRGLVIDHVLPISLGGTSARTNLQYQTVGAAKQKDRLEVRLHRQVCQGKVPLSVAQTEVQLR